MCADLEALVSIYRTFKRDLQGIEFVTEGCQPGIVTVHQTPAQVEDQ